MTRTLAEVAAWPKCREAVYQVIEEYAASFLGDYQVNLERSGTEILFEVGVLMARWKFLAHRVTAIFFTTIMVVKKPQLNWYSGTIAYMEPGGNRLYKFREDRDDFP
jgi:hypothetical protein